MSPTNKCASNSFGVIGDYSRPSGRPVLSTLLDINQVVVSCKILVSFA